MKKLFNEETEKKDEFQAMIDLYLKAKSAYYEGKDIMTDAEFDELENKIKEVDPNNKVLSIVGYSTKRFEYSHITPMLSLEKIQVNDELNSEFEEIIKWCSKTLTKEPFIIQPKYDGNSLSAQYKDGKLIRVLTRGDGKKGFEVTDKISKIIPNKVKFKGSFEIRGECLINVNDFEIINKNNKFKNERNFVAGVLSDTKNNKNSDKLKFVTFSITNQYAENYSDLLKELESKGFEISDYWFSDFKTIEDIKKFYHKMSEYRKTSKYRLDGFVIKVNDYSTREKLGFNKHHPLSEIAIKFPAQKGITQILDIEWTMSSQGELVPTAILEPVYLDGSTVSRAYLANLKNAYNNDYLPSATIQVEKKGDIIPQITKLIKHSTTSNKESLKPTECPFCKSELEYTEDLTHIYCSNKKCPEMMIKKFYKGIQILKLRNIGPSMVRKLYEAGVENVLELFNKNLTPQKLIENGDFKEGRALERVFESINSIKSIEYSDLLRIEQIDGIGSTISKMITKYYLGAQYSFSGFDKSIIKELTTNKDKYFIALPKKWTDTTNIEITYPNYENEEEKTKVILTGSPKEAGYPTKKYFLDRFTHLEETKSFKDAKILITGDKNSTSSKMKKAIKNGLEIKTYDEF